MEKITTDRDWFALHPDTIVDLDEIAAFLRMKKSSLYERVGGPDCPIQSFKSGKRRVARKRNVEAYAEVLEEAGRRPRRHRTPRPPQPKPQTAPQTSTATPERWTHVPGYGNVPDFSRLDNESFRRAGGAA